MSHLSILPTVLRDADCLVSGLERLGLTPCRGGRLEGFGGESEPVEVQVTLRDGTAIGWRSASDGSLALVGDLHRISRSAELQRWLGDVTRAYAAQMALQQALATLPDAVIEVGA